MRAAPGPESKREREELFLLHRVEHHRRRPLDDLVFQRSNGERTLSSIRLWNVKPAVTAVGDTLLGVAANENPRDCARGLPHRLTTSAHPRRLRHSLGVQ
jgi:hypothetical protein